MVTGILTMEKLSFTVLSKEGSNQLVDGDI